MLINILLLLLFIFVGRYILISIKTGKLNSYYGENMSPVFNEEPIGFIIILFFYIGVWLLFAYLLYARWPWFSF